MLGPMQTKRYKNKNISTGTNEADTIATALSANSTLLKPILCYNKYVLLVQANNSELQELNLCWNKIGELGAKSMKTMLRINSKLLVMQIDGNKIKSIITAALPTNYTLRTIKLFCSYIY
jgi:hypothetical protein